MVKAPDPILKERKALFVGIANDNSIAFGCAQAFAELGANLAVTYLNERSRPYVGAEIFMPLDVDCSGSASKESSCDSHSGRCRRLDPRWRQPDDRRLHGRGYARTRHRRTRVRRFSSLRFRGRTVLESVSVQCEFTSKGAR